MLRSVNMFILNEYDDDCTAQKVLIIFPLILQTIITVYQMRGNWRWGKKLKHSTWFARRVERKVGA